METAATARTTAETATADKIAGDKRWLPALVAVCLLCLLVMVSIGSKRDFIGSPDQAAYAEQADALLAGRGLTIGYVQHFYRPYADIMHPEDHYAPGAGVMLAGAFLLFGRSEFSAIIPSLLFACLLLPLLCYALARRLTTSPPVAFAGAITVLFAAPIREHAFYALADLPFATCLIGALLLTLYRGKLPAIGVGALLAAAFYLKPTALLVLPILLLAYWLHRRSVRQAAVSIVLCCLVFGLLIAPWLHRNQALFQDPLYSVNRHIAAGVDFDDQFWQTQFAKVWWADSTQSPPELHAVVQRYGAKQVASTVLFRLQRALFGVSAWASFSIILSLAVLLVLAYRRRIPFRGAENGSETLPPARGLLIIALVVPLFVLILCLTFSVRARYLLPIIPLGILLAWILGERLLRLAEERWAWKSLQAPVVFPIVLLCAIAGGVTGLLLQFGNIVPLQRDDDTVKRPAIWAGMHLPPDAHVMSTEPWQFRYYAQRAVVNVPQDTPEHIAAVVGAYRIRYIVVCGSSASAESLGALTGYLDTAADAWVRIRPSGEYFTLYIHRDAAWPIGITQQEQ